MSDSGETLSLIFNGDIFPFNLAGSKLGIFLTDRIVENVDFPDTL